MPPHTKYTREMIIKAALEITRESGLEAVTARELGKKLGCSSRPVFTAFANMEEVQQEVVKETMNILNEYLGFASEFRLEFKKIGMQMIRFAMEEPQLFQIVYLQQGEGIRSFSELLGDLGEYYTYSVEVCQRDYGLTKEKAEKLFHNVWIQTYGISILCATKMCTFTEEEVAEMLGETFFAMILLLKSDKLADYGQKPKKLEE